MTNFDIYKLLNFTVNKDIYAQAISPDEFDLELKAKNMRHFRKRLGLPETYVPGSANEGAGTTRLTDKDLLPFLVEETRNPVNGVINILSNWYYIIDFYTNVSITADLMSIDEVSNRINNYITKPTAQHLAAFPVKAGLRIYPSTTNNVTVLYYRTPNTPHFVTSVNSTTYLLEYNSIASTELEWDDGNKMDILYMIMQDMGLNVERGDVQQMAAKLIQQGK